jgi:beta-glucosidase-like glycosyl hydrolase
MISFKQYIVNNCVPNESVKEAANAAQQAAIAIAKKKKKGVAEGSLNESVIRSETIGPYTHDLHKTPWGYQVRVHAGGKQVHSDITKPTEEKGHRSFDSNIAYTKKQLGIKEQELE